MAGALTLNKTESLATPMGIGLRLRRIRLKKIKSCTISCALKMKIANLFHGAALEGGDKMTSRNEQLCSPGSLNCQLHLLPSCPVNGHDEEK